MSKELSKEKDDFLNERSLIFYMGSGEDEVEGSKDKVFEAMDLYAQQEAIGFDVWKMKNNYTWTLDNNDNMIWYNLIDFVAYRFYYSHEELYNLYKQSKEKQL